MLVSFGEIDCRIDEGFLPAHRKQKGELSVMVSETVTGYLEFLTQANAECHHRLIPFTVPAPVYMEKFTEEENKARADLIKIFNNELLKQCKDHAMQTVDVYSASVADNCFANGNYHIDAIHLGPAILSEIQSQLC